MRLIPDKEHKALWSRICAQLCFSPAAGREGGEWLAVPGAHKRYPLVGKGSWDDAQEKLVNDVFCRLSCGELYALDWQHDGYVFDPREELPFAFCAWDAERGVNMYFPSYYPDGDFHFFVNKDISLGLYGHPWKKELILVGEELINGFEKVKEELELI